MAVFPATGLGGSIRAQGSAHEKSPANGPGSIRRDVEGDRVRPLKRERP